MAARLLFLLALLSTHFLFVRREMPYAREGEENKSAFNGRWMHVYKRISNSQNSVQTGVKYFARCFHLPNPVEDLQRRVVVARGPHQRMSKEAKNSRRKSD